MCRELEKFLTPRISKKAMEKAREIPGFDSQNFFKLGWKHRESVLKDPDRSIFHLEHVEPVKQIANKVLQFRYAEIDQIAKVIAIAEIAWILKTEDNALNRKGHRSNRPDPHACYLDAGIELLEG